MQAINFDNRNAFLGLGSVTLYLLAIIFQIIIALFLKIFIFITGEKYINKSHLQKMLKGLFYNLILSMSMEGYIEFLVYGVLNICTIDTSSNGEILGMLFAFICIFSAVIFLPSALIWTIFSKDESQLVKHEF